ncbi:uncharacterized protein LAESUDRAFT_732855 [Laetiporus sulphureus 93-53]|uniref:UspA domain-containing protein n=1 Tax=Laetiporus sulphureus 93-53 TaxID=1314785 RepID=A0A165AWT4_9APHY|nr:uncharacterized protein LAESUDRAFT_732855 [Laetiporus sulphureus 93-53]KZS99804.1 hypothetical protein LAESUDRAFT_732855 [Laetiporus sulphureus 93-53]
MTSPEREQSRYMPIPGPPLRSAMKHSSSPISRPDTPGSTSIKSPLLSTSNPIALTSSPSPLISTPLTASPGPPSPLVAAQGYTPKVSFDTLENPQASMFSYTLHVQSDGYKRNRHTRVFLCASSPDESGTQALDWALESLVQDGDELIVFRGVDTEVLEKDHDQYREDARELMRYIQERCVEFDAERKLSIIVEYIAGKVPETIDRLISLYRPDSIVVGTRGQRGMMQAWGAAFGAPGKIGSVSKYCLSHSPVPIIVVRPEDKVRRSMAKRRADPKRGKHFDELYKTRTHAGSTGVPFTATMTR